LIPRILIVDGVTGTGKSSVLVELRKRLPREVEFIPEEDTLGDLMDQIRDPVWRAQPSFEALEAALVRLERDSPGDPRRPCLVERFHLTAFALFPEWKWYDGFDERLSKLGAAIVLLTFPPQYAEVRSVQRSDRKDWDKGMDAWYGSRARAISAVLDSQRLRVEGLLKTRLPFLHIDTRTKEWQRYAETIFAYWRTA
jgi:hypothetical protein